LSSQTGSVFFIAQIKNSEKKTTQKKVAKPNLNSSSKDPKQIWDDYFSKRKPQPKVVSALILQLHQGKKYAHVIAALEAAIRNGQAQPWMYDVLALTMKIENKPQEEIERVLLSRVDFTAADVPNILYSAAHLTRFRGNRQALTLYRQASRLAPARPEPYILGLKLARSLKDYEAVQWAATGILINAWPKDFQRLHNQAEDVAIEAIDALKKQKRDKQANVFIQAIAEAKKRDLILKLTWNGNGDLDLIVEEPLGSICSLENPQTHGGGVSRHDGYGPKPENCYEEYICAQGFPGAYRVKIRHIRGLIVGKRAILHITRQQGSNNESTQKITVPIGKVETTVRVDLPAGRRKKQADKVDDEKTSQRFLNSLLQYSVFLAPKAQNRNGAAKRFHESRKKSAIAAGNVGYQPIISVLSEGATLNASALVSPDRRYVRLTLTPTFSTLTDVLTFSFMNR